MIALLALLGRYKLLLEIIVIGVIASGAVYEVHQFLEHERGIGRAEVQGRWDAQVAKDTADAAKKTKDWGDQKDAAQTEGVKRDETIRTLAIAVTAASGGLRDAIAKTNRGLPDYSNDALRTTISTYGELLAECSAAGREVASETERINSEKQTLIDAWPTPNSVDPKSVSPQNVATPKR